MMPIPANPTNASIQPQSLYDAWADLAWRAMLTEVNLSPKPGLVDRLNCGAHKDMALADFHRSAEAIRHWLPRFMEYGASCTRLPPESVLAGLRPLGMACEAAMFRATAGVNTHKGSIFSLGLLCAAIGRLYQLRQPIAAETLCATAADFCRGLTTRELRQNNLQLTAGQRLYQQLGLTGARGGADGLRWLQQQAAVLLHQGGIRTPDDLVYLHRFDQQCIERNLSPGGSADLLIVTWFLAQISQVNH
ncbi:triphosphoribosyl-dephospho-CoA synthase [Salmonella enterica]|nr:triphosphoribosyl-dephospho-CoA synthase [Salmonella enterica]EGX5875114.1 triphosphoribosyl-dephospho-CoA synthase [Salmonella enterica]EJB1635369.1 triphosphoribosyl-dephospho-CoA synthase [Salmonella enterica]